METFFYLFIGTATSFRVWVCLFLGLVGPIIIQIIARFHPPCTATLHEITIFNDFVNEQIRGAYNEASITAVIMFLPLAFKLAYKDGKKRIENL